VLTAAVPDAGPAFEAVARRSFGGRLRAASLASGTAAVDYRMEVAWDETAIARQAAETLQAFAPEAFAVPAVDVLRLAGYAEFTDLYGKKSVEPAVTLTITRALADRVEWSTVPPRNLYLIGTWEAAASLRPYVLAYVRQP
jgi:hypothetical protein